MTVHVSSPSRIHATLIDMNGTSGRIDGSVGISLNEPRWSVALAPSKSGIRVTNKNEDVCVSHVTGTMKHVLRKLGVDEDAQGMHAIVSSGIPRHVGLGSHTQLSLALVDGVRQVLNHDIPRSRNTFASIVGRGGTSGIGITSYFEGGAIIDGGHDFGTGGEKKTFSPSSASVASPAPVIMRATLPDSWKVVCAIPRLEQGAHDAKEVDIFKRFCPVPLQEVERLCHVILMRLMPAIKQQDFHGVCECINLFQDLGFKKVEVDLRGREYRDLMRSWRDSGAPCVGMSSFGPTLYALAASDGQAADIKNAIDGILGSALERSFITTVDNKGASITTS